MLTLQGVNQRVESIQFSPNGRMLIAPGDDFVHIWCELAPGTVRMKHIMAKAKICSFRFTPDGCVMLGGFQLSIHDPNTKQSRDIELEWHTFSTQFGLTPDGDALVIGQYQPSNRPRGCFYRRQLGSLSKTEWLVHAERWTECSPMFLPDGERFVVFERWHDALAYRSGIVLVTRCARTGAILSEVHPTADQGEAPIQSADRRLIATRRGGRISIFRAEDMSAEPAVIRNDNRKEFTGLAFHPSGRFLAATSNDATVKFYNTTSWKLAHAFDWDIGRLRSVAFSPDGMLAAAGGDKGKIVVWDVDF